MWKNNLVCEVLSSKSSTKIKQILIFHKLVLQSLQLKSLLNLRKYKFLSQIILASIPNF